MKKLSLVLLSGLAFAACQKSAPATSDTASANAAKSAPEVKVYGPYDVTFDTLSFMQKDGKGLKIEIDHRTIRSCWAPYLAVTKEIARGEYMVDFKPLAHPAVVCSPGMQKDIELGAVINVPGAGGLTYVRLHVKRYGAKPAPVVVTAEDNADVQKTSEEKTYQSYMFSQNEGKAFTIKVDRQTIKACYSHVGYPVSQYATRDYFVNIQPLMVPAIVCTPAMMRDLTIGAEIKVPASKGYNSANLYVTPAPGGARAKVEVSVE